MTKTANEASVVCKAALRAADQLGISHTALARVVGLLEATILRLNAGTCCLNARDKRLEFFVSLICLFRSLDAITGGDAIVARSWMRNENTALGGAPLTLIQSVHGLFNVIAYLDARRMV